MHGYDRSQAIEMETASELQGLEPPIATVQEKPYILDHIASSDDEDDLAVLPIHTTEGLFRHRNF
jgi:hypothetical protein